MADTHVLNLDEAPEDPIERIIWLDGVQEAINAELECALDEAYFNARMQERFESAVAVGKASLKKALAHTRHHNSRTGSSVRWRDGLDPTSSAYSG